MSARAWQRRRENKRWNIALRRAFATLRRDPHAVVRFREYGLVAVSPVWFDEAYRSLARDE